MTMIWIALLVWMAAASALETAEALDARMAQHYRAGEYTEAEALARQSLALRERDLGPDHVEVASALANLGSVRLSLGDLDGAEAVLERALAIWEAANGPDDPTVAVALDLLGSLALYRGHYDRGQELYTRALGIREQVYGPDSAQVAATLNNLGTCLVEAARLTEAEEVLTRALRIKEQLLDPGDPAIATALSNLGGVLAARGDLMRALEAEERALAIREAALGPDHPDVAASLNNVADALTELGDLVRPQQMYERALEIWTATLGPDHPSVAVALENQAMFLRERGDSERAVALLQRALEVTIAAYGEDDPMVAISASNLAQVLSQRGMHGEAIALHRRALELFTRRLDADHPRIATALTNLGAALLEAGQAEEALSLHRRALEVWTRRYGPAHHRVAPALHALGIALVDNALEDEALAVFEESLAIRRANLSPVHPDLALSLRQLGALHLRRGELDRARGYFDEGLRVAEDGVRLLLEATSEREALALVQGHRRSLDGYLSAYADEPVLSYEALLRWKGVVTRFSRAERSEGPTWGALEATRREVARLTLDPWQPEEAEARRERLRVLTQDKERLERELARVGAVEEAPRLDTLCAALPRRSALVDLLRYHRGKTPSYVAFVLDRRCAPVRVELGPAEPIEAALSTWRATLDRPEALTTRVDGRGAVVADQVYQPMRAAVGDARVVFVVPDGPLSALPFAALPVGAGRYLVEEVEITYLEHAHHLLQSRVQGGEGALLVGDVTFGPVGGEASTRPSRAAPCVDGSFAPLPGTATEIDATASQWHRWGRGEPALLLTGAEATESAVMRAMAGRRVVHLATHGFFATGDCRSALGGVDEGPWFSEDLVGYNPMVLSGIALAGPSGEPSEGEDGLLTAEELAHLDLRGTRLVVLSACETGLGEVRSGEGVLGLRRAFAASGAGALVMSLWSIDDEATAGLMADLYREVLRRGTSPSAALRRAQLARLARNRRELGEAVPREWGAFIATGP